MVKSRVIWMVGIACLVGGLSAQTPPVPPFEVVSIKPNKSSEGRGLGHQPGGRFTAVGIPLQQLIRIAYGRRILALRRLKGGPPKELLAMLLTLLEDRFKLKVHTESRELSIYALVKQER
jgi:hypothetical protein